MILDGFGVAPASDGNAISCANMPNFQKYIRMYPTMTLKASGEEVGLSWGEMGNSEVGHLAIGAGRVYYQLFPRINHDIQNGDFFKKQALLDAAEHVKKHKSKLHLVGMISPGGVHSMDEHCYALLAFAKQQGIDQVFVQAIVDGRDTIYNAGIDFIGNLKNKMNELGVGKIASMSGRYFAMDRDNRWDRIEKAYNAMVLGHGETATDPLEALKASYQKEVYDEQFVPTVMVENKKSAGGGEHVEPIAYVEANDAVIFFNFRPDRMREITKAFVFSDFDAFPRTHLENVFVATMAEYQEGLPVEVVYPPEKIEQTLAQVFSERGMKQLHIAETEKYAHVTFFLNGTRETLFDGEECVVIPSPKVSSYDQEPAMSAREITNRVVTALQSNTYDFIVMNFANPDMVAHTGNIDATRKAVEVVDECMGKIVDVALALGGNVFITADHGNAEELKNLRTGEMDKEHATNPVPFIIIAKQFEGQPSIAGEVPDGDLSLMSPVGMLADVAPTILAVLGIPQPELMTGQALI